MVVTRMQNYLGQMKIMVEDQEKSYKRVVQYGPIPIQDHHHNRYVRRGDYDTVNLNSEHLRQGGPDY